MLSCTNYGSEYKSLLRILISVILPTIDYATPIYSSARKSNLNKLNSIQNTGIRLSIGAFRTREESTCNKKLSSSSSENSISAILEKFYHYINTLYTRA